MSASLEYTTNTPNQTNTAIRIASSHLLRLSLSPPTSQPMEPEIVLAPGWEKRTTADGQVYYADHNTQVRTRLARLGIAGGTARSLTP